MLMSDYREMKSDKIFEEKQNESLPPNISWPDVLEEKLTPSEDTTGKWEASTTGFERKGLRFGMESSPASAEVKGSRQAQERQRQEKDIKEWIGRVRQQQQQKEEGKHAEQVTEVQKHRCWWGSSLPAHAVATGSPVEPDCMEGWKVDCRSKRSLSIFTALQAEREKNTTFLNFLRAQKSNLK